MNTPRTTQSDAIDDLVVTAIALVGLHADDVAAGELTRSASPADLRAARDQVVDGLRLNPFLDLIGIRAARALSAALDAVDHGTAAAA